ncbi:MAG TPA: ABC transporter permease [Ignavibacteriales bacterium]|nr:ABC transporter permease [Ignavibacteriales bacterium]HOL81284.1 ABC transporter permease [Ignavibacteriales bacterium]HOM66060.1 ABC transporter permease [Ignavibacteriales bacterium]HPD67552.1 ABC transporter permease [Ignavibacteriales bacterium]HPP33394.1 ABC transporter permease [Ignavibacteriales bacterium]
MKKLLLIFKLFYSFILNKYNNKINFFSYFAIGGIAIGVIALNLTLSIIDGLEESITSKIFSLNSHIVITGFSNNNFDLTKSTDFLNKNFPNKFSHIIPNASKFCLFKYKKNYDGIIVKGIKPQNLNDILGSALLETTTSITSNNLEYPIFISKTVADKYSISIKDKITLISIKNNQAPSLENPPNIFNFYVQGIFKTGIAEYDNNYFFVLLNDAQNLFGISSNEINGIELKVKDLSQIDSLTAAINKKAFYPLYARSIYDLFSNIFIWIEFQKKPIPIIMFFITIVAVFNVISTLIINIIIKTKNISVLQLLGLSNTNISLIFLLFGCFISIAGILIGNIIALILSYIQLKFNLITIPSSVYFIDTVHISIKFSNYLIVSIVAFLITILFTIIPLSIISKLKIIEILKFNES